MRGDSPLKVSDIRADLISLTKENSASNNWFKRSEKSRRNALLKACGLEATFTPKCVLETLTEDKEGNLVAVFTGRDGRQLWSGKTKLVRYPDVKQRFTSPWSYAPGKKWKSSRFSYLLRCIVENGLPAKAVKPLVRLSPQFWKLDVNSFDAIIKKLLSLVGRVVSRRTPVVLYRTVIPFLSGKVVNSKSLLKQVPLWDFRPV
jgi:hypothetical protein